MFAPKSGFPALALCSLVLVFSVGCDRGAQLELSAGSSLPDATVGDASIRGDASHADRPEIDSESPRTCDEGASCPANGGCLEGVTHCTDGGAECAPFGPPFADRGTECGEGSVCDGNGECLACGALGGPCCDGACEEGVCDMRDTCVACTEGEVCRLDSSCRLGVQSCDGEASCEDDGAAPEGTLCAECGAASCACDDEGACESCGGDGERCCGEACDDGFSCNASHVCFACDAGAACTPDDACSAGTETCDDGVRGCRAVGPTERAAPCGEGLACDGDGECAACGGDDQPCCGDTCDDGFGCNLAAHTCIACDEGEACAGPGGCSTGEISCASGEPQCMETSIVARGTTCDDGACDGTGLCAACGGEGEPCCGTSCDGALSCRTDTQTCIACTAGAACEVEGGCGRGTLACGATATCDVATRATRSVLCGEDQACDGAGECAACGGTGQPCCEGTCDEGATCHAATETCVTCPAGMIYIPAGSFDMGASDGDTMAEADERPRHRVTLSAFCIDEREVSQEAFTARCSYCRTTYQLSGTDTAECNRGAWYEAGGNNPHVCIAPPFADEYCRIRGGRLPTEAEWEYAATGGDGRRYPWGDEEPTCAIANVGASCGGEPDSPGSHPLDRSPFGVLDMGGNLREWVYDVFGSEYYAQPDATGENPRGPTRDDPYTSFRRTVRGGSWELDAVEARTTARSELRDFLLENDVGFRCVTEIR